MSISQLKIPLYNKAKNRESECKSNLCWKVVPFSKNGAFIFLFKKQANKNILPVACLSSNKSQKDDKSHKLQKLKFKSNSQIHICLPPCWQDFFLKILELAYVQS